MDLDPRICTQARLSRDARFDGRFFIGVLSTRIAFSSVDNIEKFQSRLREHLPICANHGLRAKARSQ